MTDIIISIHKKYVIETVVEVNPDLDQKVLVYTRNLENLGCKKEAVPPDTIQVTINSKANALSPFEPHHLPFVLGYDLGKVENYAPYIKVPVANIDDDILDGLPNRIYQDDAGNDVVHTWRTWKSIDNYQLPSPVEGDYYLLSYRGTGNYLKDTELLLIYNDSTVGLENSVPQPSNPIV